MEITEAEADDLVSEVLAETKWNDQKLTVKDFMEGFNSAQPVRLVPQGRDLDLNPTDLLHPLLAFSKRRRTKVYADNLVWDAERKKYAPKGPPLEIPKDYIGWFEIVGQGGTPGQACHFNVADVLKTKCRQFLLRSTVLGYLEADNNNDGEFQIGPEVKLYPGEILEVGDIITKKWKMQLLEGTEGGSNKKAKEPETKFLECHDRRQRTVYLTLAFPGKFYPLWNSDMKSKSPRMDVAYYIHDLIQFGFPQLVRVAFGWPPVDYPEFSGFLRLLGVNRPDTMILRSLKPASCVIIELPIDADVKIENMTNMEHLSGNKTFERLLGHSCDRIYPYLIGMKHMDTKYPVCVVKEKENPDDPSAEKDNNGQIPKNRDMCRMARPREMKVFDPRNIFPPLEDTARNVAESWTLSFKDPDYNVISGPMGELRDSETITVDPEGDNSRYRQFDMSRQESLIGTVQSALRGMKTDDSPANAAPRRDQIWQKRTDMEQVLLEREAEC